MGSSLWLEVWVQRLSQGPVQSASCPWPWRKEVGRMPCDTSRVTEGDGQQTPGSQGNLRRVCQSRSVSGVVSGVKLKVRPNRSISMPTSPWVPFVSVAGTQVPTQLAMALVMLVCPSAPGTSSPSCSLPVPGMHEDQSTHSMQIPGLPSLPHCKCSSLHELQRGGCGAGGKDTVLQEDEGLWEDPVRTSQPQVEEVGGGSKLLK